MNTKNLKPLMISFQRNVGELRLLGLVAWGGVCLDVNGLRARDLASRLGASKLWLETLLEVVSQSGTRHVVLVDPDFSVFLGQPAELEGRLRRWAESQGVLLTSLQTRALGSMAA
ncbi:MAG: hypothetical protein WC326_03995 [Candidatus Delongbacteria bacterium]